MSIVDLSLASEAFNLDFLDSTLNEAIDFTLFNDKVRTSNSRGNCSNPGIQGTFNRSSFEDALVKYGTCALCYDAKDDCTFCAVAPKSTAQTFTEFLVVSVSGAVCGCEKAAGKVVARYAPNIHPFWGLVKSIVDNAKKEPERYLVLQTFDFRISDKETGSWL